MNHQVLDYETSGYPCDVGYAASSQHRGDFSRSFNLGNDRLNAHMSDTDR